MIYEINISEDVVNEVYQSFVFGEPKHKEIFIYGSAGSGKSYATAQHILFNMMMSDYYRCLYIRKVHKTIRNSQYQLFIDIINSYGFNKLFDIRETDMRITCRHNGNMLIAVGLDDSEKIKSIQDPNVAWVEEATEITLSDYLQVRGRLRKADVPVYTICTFNPVSVNSWLYNYINVKSDVFVLHTTADNNRYINEEYLKVLDQSKMFNENWYRIYRLGEWGNEDEVRVLKNYEIQALPSDMNYDCFGIDVGYVNPTAVVGVKIDIDKRIIYVREILYETHLSFDDVYLKVKDIFGQTPVFADSSEPGFIDTLYLKGLNIHKSNKDVKYGLMKLQSFKLIIDSNSANLIREVSQYSFQKDRYDNVVELPIKKDDHLVDALRYAVTTYLDKFIGANNHTMIFKDIKFN